MSPLARNLLSLAVATALVALLLWVTGVTPSAVWSAVRSLEAGTWALALGVQVLLYPLRALRLRALLDGTRPRPLGLLTAASAAHNLVAYLLPARVGEASLPVYLRRGTGRSLSEGGAVLYVARLLDFACLSGAMAAACFAIGASGAYPGLGWLTGAGALLLLPTLGFTWLVLNGGALVRGLEALLRVVRLGETAVGARALAFTARLKDRLAAIGRGQVLAAALWTLPIWGIVFLFWAILARGLGMQDLGWFEAVFGSSLAVLSTLVPINAFAGFGTQDAGWVFGFTALGVERGLATSSALAAHLVYVANLVLVGLVGHALVGRAAGGDAGKAAGDPE